MSRFLDHDRQFVEIRGDQMEHLQSLLVGLAAISCGQDDDDDLFLRTRAYVEVMEITDAQEIVDRELLTENGLQDRAVAGRLVAADDQPWKRNKISDPVSLQPIHEVQKSQSPYIIKVKSVLTTARSHV